MIIQNYHGTGWLFYYGQKLPGFKKRSPTNGSHKWETIWESMESVERNVNGFPQMDIRIRLRNKSFHS